MSNIKTKLAAALGSILLVLLLGCNGAEQPPDNIPPDSTVEAVTPTESADTRPLPHPTRLGRESGRLTAVGIDSTLSCTDQRILFEDGALIHLDASSLETHSSALDLALIHYQTIEASQEAALKFLKNQAYSKPVRLKTSNVFVYTDDISALADKGWFAGNHAPPGASGGYVEVVWTDGTLSLGANILPEDSPLEHFLRLNCDDTSGATDLTGHTGAVLDNEVSLGGITPGMPFPEVLGHMMRRLASEPGTTLTIDTELGLHLGDSYIAFYPSSGQYYVSYVQHGGPALPFRGHQSLEPIIESMGVSDFTMAIKGATKELYRSNNAFCQLYAYDCIQLCAETTGGFRLCLIFDAEGKLISLKSSQSPVLSEAEQLRVRKAVQHELSGGRWTLADATVIRITYESIYLELSSDDSDTRKIIDIPNNFDYTAALTEILLAGETPKLRQLELDYFPYSDIAFLADCPNLYHVRIGGGNIRSLEPLSKLRKLESLYFCNQNISDISPLAKLPILMDAGLDGNYICDASLLRDMAVYGPLSYLHLDSNPLTHIGQPLNLVEGSSYLLAPDGYLHYYLDISFKNTPFEEHSLFYDFLD